MNPYIAPSFCCPFKRNTNMFVHLLFLAPWNVETYMQTCKHSFMSAFASFSSGGPGKGTRGASAPGTGLGGSDAGCPPPTAIEKECEAAPGSGFCGYFELWKPLP